MTQSIPKGRPLPKGFLKYGAAGLDNVEKARQDMIAAKEPARTHRGGNRVPSFIENAAPSEPSVTVEEVIADADALEEPQPAESAPVRQLVRPAVQPQPQPPQQAARPQQPQQPLDVQKVETDRFSAQIFRDGKAGFQWTAVVTYKPDANGMAPGTENFAAKSKDELLLKLLQAKSHATLKIREMVQREKIGFRPDTWDAAFYSRVREMHNLTKEQYAALPKESQATIADTVQADYARDFLASTPDYYPTDANFKALGDYLNKQKWPISLNNLTYAFRELTRQGKLETAPTAVPQAPVAAVPVAYTAAPAATVPPTRKRAQGPSGIIPGASSASAGSQSSVGEARESNEAELRSLPMSELRKRAIPSLSGGRQ